MQNGTIVIIGYGNPLRGDDGLGWQVARHLLTTLEAGEWGNAGPVQVLPRHQLTPELADPLSQARLAVFVDARVGELPGAIVREEISARPPRPGAFSHHFDPPALLAWAQWLYGAAPARAIVYSVVGQTFDYSEQLSPAVLAAVPTLQEQIVSLVME
jgi:hydrogenase maturation protease